MLFSTAKIFLVAAALAAAVNAQVSQGGQQGQEGQQNHQNQGGQQDQQGQCTPKQTMCAEDEVHLLKCNDKSSWETETCGSDQYCMTMNEAMIHCMLKPDDWAPASQSKPTATSSEEQPSETASSTSASHDSHDSSSSTESGASAITNGHNAVIAAVAGLVVLGMGAMF